jgi:ArsR family transcriptional regulator
MHEYRFAAKKLKAMAHPVRLAILRVLQLDEDCCVCHLENALGQRQAYISQQLARLRKVDLVDDRREGLNVYYSLSDDSVGVLLDCVLEGMRKQAGLEGIKLQFEAIDPERGMTCPCPRCTTEQEQEKVKAAFQEKR